MMFAALARLDAAPARRLSSKGITMTLPNFTQTPAIPDSLIAKEAATSCASMPPISSSITRCASTCSAPSKVFKGVCGSTFPLISCRRAYRQTSWRRNTASRATTSTNTRSSRRRAAAAWKEGRFGAVPGQNLHVVAALAAKHERRPRIRVGAQRLRDIRSQPVEAAPMSTGLQAR